MQSLVEEMEDLCKWSEERLKTLLSLRDLSYGIQATNVPPRQNINRNGVTEQPSLTLTKKQQRQIENKIIQSLTKNQGGTMMSTNDLTSTTGTENPIRSVDPTKNNLRGYHGKVAQLPNFLLMES